MDFIEQERLNSADLVNNATPPVLVCICVDASYSMIGSRIDHVNKGISKFIKSGTEDPYARDALQVCIISFSGKGVQIEQPFAPVYQCRFSPIKPDGGTPLGAAVIKAIEEIFSRKARNESHGVLGFKPWLILMSDGDASDDISEAVRIVKKNLAEHRIKVKCIGMGDNEGKGHNSLAKFSPDGEVQTCDSLQIENFFSMLSRSAAGLSCSAPGEEEDNFDLKL